MNKTALRKTINWVLIPLLLLTLYSGVKLHVTDFNLYHHKWHSLAVFHIVSGLLMLLALMLHLWQHWSFYKSIFRPLKAKKAKLRRLGVLILTALFLFLVLSGIWMLVFDGDPWKHLGLIHFWIGILASLFVIDHILKRYKSFQLKRK